jgi:hypothetical protein
MTKLTIAINIQANLNEKQQDELTALARHAAQQAVIGWIHVEQLPWIKAEAEAHLET